MATYKVTFLPSNKTFQVDSADLKSSRHGKPGCILDIARQHGIRIESACGGVGVCGTCHVIVVEGMKNLSPPDEDELDSIDRAPGNTPESRLACQAQIHGDVTVSIPVWNRNLVGEGQGQD
jgi:2Fe-2S ferredoxin